MSSNNPFPEPPKLSTGNDLLKKINEDSYGVPSLPSPAYVEPKEEFVSISKIAELNKQQEVKNESEETEEEDKDLMQNEIILDPEEDQNNDETLHTSDNSEDLPEEEEVALETLDETTPLAELPVDDDEDMLEVIENLDEDAGSDVSLTELGEEDTSVENDEVITTSPETDLNTEDDLPVASTSSAAITSEEVEATKDEESPLEEALETITSELRSEESEGTTDSSEAEEEEKGDIEVESQNHNHTPWNIIKHTGYVTTSVWALLTAAATGAAGWFLTPGDYTWIALAVLGFMTGVIAAVDRKTHLIKDQHTVITAVITVPLALIVAFNLGSWNFLFGIISAVIAMGVFIFLVIKVNFGSGGDIKFSPVPAFTLGVINPLIAAVWLFYAMIITLVFLVVRKQKATSFGEGMAIALPFAIATVYGLYSLAGLPYMESVTV